MRKSTKAILIALAVLIGPAIYSGYLLYRESKVVDLVSVEVIDSAGQKLSGIVVGLFPQWEKKPFRFKDVSTDNGTAEFHNLPPGEYKIIILYPRIECDSFKIKIEGVKVYIRIPLDECSITTIVTPK